MKVSVKGVGWGMLRRGGGGEGCGGGDVGERGDSGLTDRNFLILAARISSFFHCSVESYCPPRL